MIRHRHELHDYATEVHKKQQRSGCSYMIAGGLVTRYRNTDVGPWTLGMD